MTTLKTRFASLLLAATALASGASFAHDGNFAPRRDEPRAHWGHAPERDIDARQRFQHERIEAGRRSGALTPREFMRLMRQQQEIRVMERQFMADGHLSRFEYERLDTALDRSGHAIRRQARDDDRFAHDDHRPRGYN